MKIKLLLCGTYPKQYNGYSKVIYELIKFISTKNDIDLHVWGFQKFYETPEDFRPLPNNINLVNVVEKEDPKRSGFGEIEIKEYIEEIKPNVIVVFNDLYVLSSFTQNIYNLIKKYNIVYINYIDQVYYFHKQKYINLVNEFCSHTFTFTDFWKNMIYNNGLRVPCSTLHHGIDKNIIYKIPTSIARLYYNLDPKHFIILNLNRNQPRKRWDICIPAYVEFLSRHKDDKNIKLFIGTDIENGSWNLIELYKHELHKRNMTFQEFEQCIITTSKAQQLSDFEINIVYNCADIGVNTCDGEGFGLCNYEHAYLGKPQVIPKIGGFLDFFDNTNSILIEPRQSYYVDVSRDQIGGEAQMCSYMDFADGLDTYYQNRQLLEKHGKECRKKILNNPYYEWSSVGNIFYQTIKNVYKKHTSFQDKRSIDQNFEYRIHENVKILLYQNTIQNTPKEIKLNNIIYSVNKIENSTQKKLDINLVYDCFENIKKLPGEQNEIYSKELYNTLIEIIQNKKFEEKKFEIHNNSLLLFYQNNNNIVDIISNLYPNIEYFLSLKNNSEKTSNLIVSSKLEKNVLKEVYPNIPHIYSLEELYENFNTIELKNTYIFNNNEYLSNTMLYKNIPFIQEFIPYVVEPIKKIVKKNNMDTNTDINTDTNTDTNTSKLFYSNNNKIYVLMDEKLKEVLNNYDKLENFLINSDKYDIFPIPQNMEDIKNLANIEFNNIIVFSIQHSFVIHFAKFINNLYILPIHFFMNEVNLFIFYFNLNKNIENVGYINSDIIYKGTNLLDIEGFNKIEKEFP